jgi:hypothetical protein
MTFNHENLGDVILDGAVGIYQRVDLNRASSDTSVLVPFDSDLNSLGFKLVGDLMCSALGGFLRCYVQPEERTRALLLAGINSGKLNIFGLVFEANFSKGVSLTTTTSKAMRDMPEKGIHRRVYAWTNVYELYRKHLEHMNELKVEHGEAEPMQDTLLSLAESLDAATVRMSG